MAIFFFVVGLEVKRELVLGELRDRRAAALPVFAALGGMMAPAAIYLALQAGEPGARGWGIPMATDIAFVVGCLALLGPRMPIGLRILLLSLAIADDIGAVLIIAVGYTSDLDAAALAAGMLGLGVVVLMARLGVRRVAVYLLLGALVWFAFHESGVHATVAGVLLGLLTPARPWVDEGRLRAVIESLGAGSRLQERGDTAGETGGDAPLAGSDDVLGGRRHHGRDPEALRLLEVAARESHSPLERLETALHPWVAYVVMPLFALANAGVRVERSSLGHSVVTAVLLGLVCGKPLGIFAFSWIGVRLRIARLPAGVTWSMLAAGGLLGGIGFTMALFIAGLAVHGETLDAAKLGILSASALCATAGTLALRWRLRARQAPGE